MRKDVSVIVTSGGTRESLDDVRSITNNSTGRLGSIIADTFALGGAKVTYVCGETAARPSISVHETIEITNVASLSRSLEKLIAVNKYDCVIHAMAVSDYTPRYVTTSDAVSESILSELREHEVMDGDTLRRIKNAILNLAEDKPRGKISSQASDLIVVMEPTPKVIDIIKAMCPDTLLVGFKLLSGASERALVDAGLGLISRSGCDYVLANDLSGISGGAHNAFLMDAGGIIRRAGTKKEIAQTIFETIIERIGAAD